MMVSAGLLILRIVVGLTVAAHGTQKVFGWFEGPGLAGFSGVLDQLGMRPARLWAVVAAIAELAGGLLLALGLFTPIAGLVVAGDMLVAILTVHLAKGFWNSKGGYEYPLALLASALALSLTGPGAVSFDRLFGVSLPEPATWAVTAAVVLVGAAAAGARTRLGRAAPGEPGVG
jgi:putative oxidoreductase